MTTYKCNVIYIQIKRFPIVKITLLFLLFNVNKTDLLRSRLRDLVLQEKHAKQS